MKSFGATDLACLSALADEGSFEAAAQRLSITQSAVSQRLKALEEHAGCLLVVRARPLRLTAAGKHMLRYARQMAALQAQWTGEWQREWGPQTDATSPQAPSLPLAVNADSLATWVMPALNPVVLGGVARVELLVDDQDFTHNWLREGHVLGCVTTERRPLRGCTAQALGVMRYGAYASPAFVQRWLGGDATRGLTRHNFAQVPFLVFNRKDEMQNTWVAKAFGLRQPRLVEVHVPSSESYLQAVAQGWGIGVLPHLQAATWLARKQVVAVQPRVLLDVALHWHRWALGSPALDAVGEALMVGARTALLESKARKPRSTKQ
jgi:LysR family transcriptional regulator, chromosome initiation inhibitor